jgi:prolyl-tRNA editing enzyme YbaK/EbsC (Cys-tRNA(Pro) deacylase)
MACDVADQVQEKKVIEKFTFRLRYLRPHFHPEWSEEHFLRRMKSKVASFISNYCYNRKMSTTLSPSAQKIQNLLNSLGYNYSVIEHAESTRTAVEAAERAGCELGQIVKSLIFKGKQSGKPIIVLTSGANRVDEKRIREYAGEGIGKADADFVRAVTGFAIGGVPPIGHVQKIETYMDEDFLRYETVWAAAGTPNAIFELKTSDLQKMTDAKIVMVK